MRGEEVVLETNEPTRELHDLTTRALAEGFELEGLEVRRATLEKHPGLRDGLKQLGGILTVAEMRKLNYAVDGEKRQAKDVVREFLKAKGLIR